jgi:hypothetical protein
MAEFTFIEKKPMDGREHAIDSEATVGREGCDIVLPDPEVSRRHAAVRATAAGPAVEDLGSSNGTFVNGVRIEGTRQLADGDRVRFGNTEWELRATATAHLRAPQVTASRAIPAEPAAAAPPPSAPPPAAPQAAPPQAAAPQASSQEPAPAAPRPPEASQRRGDVPAPPEIVPSAIHRTLPETAQSAPPAFAPVATRQTKGSAATRAGYTAFCLALFLATLVGVTIYFIVN